MDSSLPQLPLGPGVGDATRVSRAHGAKAGRGPERRPSGSALRGRGRPNASSSGPAAGMGRRQRPPGPRHASTHRAHSRDPGLGRASESPLPSGGWTRIGLGEARESEGRGGPEEAAGPERRRVPPEPGLAPRWRFGAKPEPARWAGRRASTPPLDPAQTARRTGALGRERCLIFSPTQPGSHTPRIQSLFAAG